MKGKAKVVRHLKADEDVETKVQFLANFAIKRSNNKHQDKDTVAVASSVDYVRARCGHRALCLHYENGLRTRRLLSRQDERSLCPYCGASLEQVQAQVLQGKARRNVRKHLRSRKSKSKTKGKGKPVLMKATCKECSLCGETVIHKTFKQKKEGSGGSGGVGVSPVSPTLASASASGGFASAGIKPKKKGKEKQNERDGEKETKGKKSSLSRLLDLSKQHGQDGG